MFAVQIKPCENGNCYKVENILMANELIIPRQTIEYPNRWNCKLEYTLHTRLSVGQYRILIPVHKHVDSLHCSHTPSAIWEQAQKKNK